MKLRLFAEEGRVFGFLSSIANHLVQYKNYVKHIHNLCFSRLSIKEFLRDIVKKSIVFGNLASMFTPEGSCIGAASRASWLDLRRNSLREAGVGM